MSPTNADVFIHELKSLGSSSRASYEKKYHKSNREHWGVSAPDCNQAVREFTKTHSEEEILETARFLWNTDVFDLMIAAAKILSRPKVKPTQQLWNQLISFLQNVDGWALEDTLAHAAWKCILADDSLLDVLDSWTTHESFWMRRAVLIYTLPFAKPKRNPERSLHWASNYATDSEWFIQKAIGWWLRVLGEHNPERVVQFLNLYWKKLKTVARHEATRKLDTKWKLQITDH